MVLIASFCKSTGAVRIMNNSSADNSSVISGYPEEELHGSFSNTHSEALTSVKSKTVLRSEYGSDAACTSVKKKSHAVPRVPLKKPVEIFKSLGSDVPTQSTITVKKIEVNFL